MTAAEETSRSASVIRELIPEHGWILEPRIVELAVERGITKRAVKATLLLLACGEIEAEERNGQMWIRWRSGR